MPYRSSGNRRNSVQFGVGRSIWTGSPPPDIPEQVLDGIPGFLAWLALLMTVAGAVLRPGAVIVLATLLGFYSAVRFVFGGIANVMGNRYIRRWEALDWYAVYAQEAGPDAIPREDVLHMVLIPSYKEPLAVLCRTLEALSQQDNAATQIAVVMAMEAADSNAQTTAETMRDQFKDKFAHFFYQIYPKGLPGEMQCKSANIAWASRWAKRKLVDDLGYSIDHIVVTTMDADTQWHPMHFAALTTSFAVHPQRYLRFWQGPIRYHANIWEIPPAMALIHAYSSAWELAYLAAPWWIPLPMSSYSLSLRLLDGVGYWDSDVIADEWHMFIKAYFRREGAVRLERIFLPFMGDATAGEGMWDTVKARYQQTLRHAWGSKEVGYTIARMIENPQMRFWDGFTLLFRVAHDIILAGAGWVIMTIGPPIAFLLNPEYVNWNSPIFVLLQISLVMITLMGIVFWLLDIRVRPPRTHPWTLRERLMTLISFPMLAILSVIFLALPNIHAQTLLLLGIPIQFKVTKKI